MNTEFKPEKPSSKKRRWSRNLTREDSEKGKKKSQRNGEICKTEDCVWDTSSGRWEAFERLQTDYCIQSKQKSSVSHSTYKVVQGACFRVHLLPDKTQHSSYKTLHLNLPPVSPLKVLPVLFSIFPATGWMAVDWSTGYWLALVIQFPKPNLLKINLVITLWMISTPHCVRSIRLWWMNDPGESSISQKHEEADLDVAFVASFCEKCSNSLKTKMFL